MLFVPSCCAFQAVIVLFSLRLDAYMLLVLFGSWEVTSLWRFGGLWWFYYTTLRFTSLLFLGHIILARTLILTISNWLHDRFESNWTWNNYWILGLSKENERLNLCTTFQEKKRQKYLEFFDAILAKKDTCEKERLLDSGEICIYFFATWFYSFAFGCSKAQPFFVYCKASPVGSLLPAAVRAGKEQIEVLPAAPAAE